MRKVYVFIVLFLVFYNINSYAEEQQQQPQAAATQKEIIRVTTPQNNSEVIDKKPLIKAEFLEAVNASTLLVALDGTDVTQLLTVTENGFEYKSFLVLPAGMHKLSITAADKEGKQIQKDISFMTRHSQAFQEVYTNNELSATYETVITKPDAAASLPDSKLEGNIRSDTKLKEKDVEFTFNTNLRILDQSLPVNLPMKKGLDVANWLLTGNYIKDNIRLNAKVGDVQINETQYTLKDLSRRGGVLTLGYEDYSLNLFSVKSQQVLGLNGGAGIDGNSDDHILGVSAGVKLFERKVEFKTIYVTGGDQGSSFGTYSASAAKQKGDVLGFVMTSDFFSNKIKTELETDFSNYDPDTSDEFNSRQDKAYKAKISGYLNNFNYEALYEYIGKDYMVIGNQGLQKDKEGITLRGGANLGAHNINLTLTRYNDNIRGDELFPRIVNWQSNLEYSFNKIPELPMGITWQKSIQESTIEPQGSTPMSLYTDTVTGRISYRINDAINLGLQAMCSLMDDRTASNNDSRTMTYTVTPAYTTPSLQINPNFSLNKAKNLVTDITTDTYTINLDLKSKFFHEKASFEMGGTYNIVKTDNGNTNTRNLNTHFRLAYSLKDLFKRYLNPSIGIRGTYLKTIDKINPNSNKDERTLFLVFTTSMPFSF